MKKLHKHLTKHLTIAAFTVVTLFSFQAQAASASDNPNFIWPATGTITAKFHDKNYIYKKYFQHSGIDIGVAQGTGVQAAAKGTVVIVKKPKDTSLSYVMIQHKNNLATLYEHLSQVDVKKGDAVERGDVIGLSGGLPGTNGAGAFTTGPHLHFEVRKQGIPVNPLKYLPDAN